MTRVVELTRGAVAVVDDEDYALVSQYSWCLHSKGYAIARVPGMGTKLVYMHRLILAAPPRSQVDHRDHDKLNNCRYNLRLCTRQQNQYNRCKQASSSRYKGVSYCKQMKRWRASISINGRQKNLGRFSSEEDAALAHDAAAVLHHGEFAMLNFPQEHPCRIMARS
jgi:hypothetical protein